MSIYVGLLIIIIYISVLLKVMKLSNNNLVYTWIIGLILFIISVLRHSSVGTDLHVYIRRFYEVHESEFSGLSRFNELWGFEYGYLYFSRIISSFLANDRLLIFIVGFIIIFIFSYFFYKYSQMIWLSFFLFISLMFFGTSLNLLRLFIAVSICLISIKYIINRNLIKFLLLVVIAYLFHTSAIIFVLLYPLSKVKISIRYLSILFVLGVFFYLFGGVLLNNIISRLHYVRYASDIGSGDGTGMLILLLTILITALLFKKNNIVQEDPYFNLWIHMILLSLLFNILSLHLWIAARLMWYFKPAMLIILPNMFASIKDKKISIYASLSTAILSLVYFYLVNRSDNAGVLPYLFFWN